MTMRPRPFAALAALALLAMTHAPAATYAQPTTVNVESANIPCAQIARRISGAPGTSVVVTCPANCHRQAAWGTNVYSDDSSICAAAIHMGVTTREHGGPVELHFLPGERRYTGSERNNVRTSDWGPWSRSFSIAALGQPLHYDSDGRVIPAPSTTRTPHEASAFAHPILHGLPTEDELQHDRDATTPRATTRMTTRIALQEELPGQVHCELRGQELRGETGAVHTLYCPLGCAEAIVWGTDIYADDSSVCAAAIHAGVITDAAGGLIQVRIGGARDAFEGSEAHGVTSASWTAWPRSFTVHRPGTH